MDKKVLLIGAAVLVYLYLKNRQAPTAIMANNPSWTDGPSDGLQMTAGGPVMMY